MSKSKRKSSKIVKFTRMCTEFVKGITVEPIEFFYGLAFNITSVVDEDLYVKKACAVDLAYPQEICRNLTSYPLERTQVQIAVSSFTQWNEIATWILPVLLALFVGAYTDKRGRKFMILLGTLGRIWSSIWIVVVATQDSWRLTTIIWLSNFIAGVTAIDLAVVTGTNGYLCDVTPEEKRTLRFAILDASNMIAAPVGVALGKYLFYHVVDQSHAMMFVVNAAVLTFTFIYAWVRLEWTTASAQKMLPLCGGDDPDEPNFVIDLFDKNAALDSIKAYTTKRPFNGRSVLTLLTLSLGLYMFTNDSNQMYLYTRYVFNWNLDLFSNFRTFQLVAYLVGSLVFLPIFTSWLKFSDVTIIIIGALANLISRVIFVFTKTASLFYVGAVISCPGRLAAAAIRALVSKTIPVVELGKVMSVLSVFDVCMPMVTGITFTQVYNNTITTYPSAIFWVTATSQFCLATTALIIKFLRRGVKAEDGKTFQQVETTEEKSIPE